MIQGTRDVEAIAAGPSRFPFPALGRGLETDIEDATTRASVARFPVAFGHISTFRTGRAWVGTSGNHLYIITLEGFPLHTATDRHRESGARSARAAALGSPAHPDADPRRAAGLNAQYQGALGQWRALPFWKRIFVKQPTRPAAL